MIKTHLLHKLKNTQIPYQIILEALKNRSRAGSYSIMT